MKEYILEIDNIQKSFEGEEVLKGVSLKIEKGEFVTLLGSSGCGKTTLIRIIAGLTQCDKGRVKIAGEDITELSPNKREVNTIFQNYALFPHMNVYDNIAYGLKIKKTDKETIRKKVKEVLHLVDMEGSEKRSISKLSGGQKQRIAIARAIVNEPKILLLDEPLGALDLKLKRHMQSELKALQEKLGVTFIYITHDQEEAINLSDRIAVIHNGRVEQVGTPDEIYNKPRTKYVADFIFEANVISGTVKEITPEYLLLENKGITIRVANEKYDVKAGQNISVAFRGENVGITKEETAGFYKGEIVSCDYLGGQLRLTVKLKENFVINVNRNGVMSDYKKGDAIYVGLDDLKAVVLEQEKDCEK